MKKKLQTAFSPRQYMLSQDFELYYYNDHNLSTVNMHTHPYYEFYFFLEGNVSMQIGDSLYPLGYGDIMLIPPMLSHRLLIHGTDMPYRRFVLWISRDYGQHLLALSPDYGYLTEYAQKHQTYLFHTDQLSFNSVQSKILRLLEEMHDRRFGRDAQIPLCINDLILLLNRIVYTQKHAKIQAEETPLFERLVEYIEEHLDEDLSLERLSDAFFVSKYHISHVFKNNLGISIHQYITKKRLALCREAMTSDAPVSDLYLGCGFGDYSSFYRAFKKEYGISPKEYRDTLSLLRKI